MVGPTGYESRRSQQRDEWVGQMISTGAVVPGDRWAAVGDETAGSSMRHSSFRNG